MDVDEQLTDVDEFLIALWQEMKVPYMGTFQFLLWVGDYFLFRFYDENSLFSLSDFLDVGANSIRC